MYVIGEQKYRGIKKGLPWEKDRVYGHLLTCSMWNAEHLKSDLASKFSKTTITDGVFSHIWSYKEHGHNDLTICKIKYMAKELKMYSTNWYIFCPSKTMLRYWNWQKEIDLVFSHFCHARVTEKSCRHQPKLLISDQTTVLPKWTRHAEFELIPDFVTPSPFV